MSSHPASTDRPTDIIDLVARFETRTLAKAEWTHEAHLTVCLATLRRLGPDAALDHLRASIRAYNDVVGTPNTATSGYHETLTRYYLGAVAAAAADAGTRDGRDGDVLDRLLADVLVDETCGREAPLRHWSRDRLFSVAARREWSPPDLAPLRWT